MKIKVEKEVEVSTLKVEARVRYWEDSEVDGVSDEDGSLIPCREGENWCPEIEIKTGKILNWKQGVKASIHYKVCDCCFWALKDKDGETQATGDGYVPSTLSPKEPGYGDYIIMDIDETGQIAKWKFEERNFSNE